MAIYRGVIHNGIIVPEVPLLYPEGTRVQILVSEGEIGVWDEAFEQIQKVAEMIAQSATQTLNLGRLVEEGREELEKNG
jgi:biotin synthase-like enzyme